MPILVLLVISVFIFSCSQSKDEKAYRETAYSNLRDTVLEKRFVRPYCVKLKEIADSVINQNKIKPLFDRVDNNLFIYGDPKLYSTIIVDSALCGLSNWLNIRSLDKFVRVYGLRHQLYIADYGYAIPYNASKCTTDFVHREFDSVYYKSMIAAINGNCSAYLYNQNYYSRRFNIPQIGELDRTQFSKYGPIKTDYIEYQYFTNQISYDSLTRYLKNHSLAVPGGIIYERGEHYDDYRRYEWMIRNLDHRVARFVINDILLNDSTYIQSQRSPRGTPTKMRDLFDVYVDRFYFKIIDSTNKITQGDLWWPKFEKSMNDSTVWNQYEPCRKYNADMVNTIDIDICKYLTYGSNYSAFRERKIKEQKLKLAQEGRRRLSEKWLKNNWLSYSPEKNSQSNLNYIYIYIGNHFVLKYDSTKLKTMDGNFREDSTKILVQSASTPGAWGNYLYEK